MKKIYMLLFTILASFALINVVNAETDYSYRATKEGKAVIDINGVKFYVSVSLLFDMDGSFSSTRLPVGNVEAKFENDGLYVTVKRSEINKVLRENKFENVYSLLEINADFLDIDNTKKYYYFHQLNHEIDEYSYTKGEEDYYYRTHNFLPVYSTSMELSGLFTDNRHSYGGGFIMYEGTDYPDIEIDSKFKREEIVSNDRVIINVPRTNVYATLIEDEAIDLGENTTIIDSHGTFNEETGEYDHETMDINNFYGEYFDNNKLKYSWTMYDENGNPVNIDVNTTIKLDDSENEEEILSSFSHEINNLKDRIKIISFEHEGELGGTAKVRLYVGDKFTAGETLTLYYYNPEKKGLENIENEYSEEDILETHDQYNVLVDEEGYVTIELTHCSEYVLAESEVKPIEVINSNTTTTKDEIKTNKENESDIKRITIDAIILSVVIIVALVFAIIYNKKRKKSINQ